MLRRRRDGRRVGNLPPTYDPARPVVCLDEVSKQLVAETRPPLIAEPGQPARADYEYERRGTANRFLTCEPLTGRRHVTVTPRRTAVARALLDRLEMHHTPKHGSWLNMAEIELSVLSRQCLDRRIADADTLTQAVAAWEQARNSDARPVNWRFTTPDAQIKLKRLYPSIQDG